MEYIQNFDLVLFKWIHFTLKNELFDVLMPFLRNKLTWIPLYLYLVNYLRRNYPANYWKIILAALVLVCLSDLICAKVLKEYFERMRPCQIFFKETWYSDFKLCSPTFSFPSCHALNHAALAMFLASYFERWGKFLLGVWVFSIGYSQVYVGVHYPTDILGGILIGISLSYIGSAEILRNSLNTYLCSDKFKF